ncbi:hypothetical protein PF008_g14903 [Phytophthora fragariae]|nr:hypothetical protein PF008_g14903 [Phytophthora fragariae]
MLVVRKDQARILEQTLQLLFSCEVLVVTEFVKVLVPLVLGLLLATLWTLPSARYSILLRALVIVCVTVFKKYGISTVHLLAFLLEQQCANFQTKLVSCFIALVFSTSAHQGMDWASGKR